MVQSSAELRRFADADTLARTIAGEIAVRLTRACADRGRAALVVSGGRSPVRLFEELRRQPLDWSRLFITLADERWLDASAAASNERLVREALLRGKAAAARFVGLKNPASSARIGAATSWEALASVPRPFDVTLLGMGDDGHTASLFPGSPGLGEALEASVPAGCVAMWSRSAPHERVSLNMSALLESRHISILILGEEKLAVYERARSPGPAEEMPVRGILRQSRVPVQVIWAPAKSAGCDLVVPAPNRTEPPTDSQAKCAPVEAGRLLKIVDVDVSEELHEGCRSRREWRANFAHGPGPRRSLGHIARSRD
ncbi:MAG TPA: 6-phosphogluconolactonase [Steroidobacteraceae bacterium]|nr:6-phosphogluconolactonase [Steroidobacteraceae bacterium]